MNFNFYLKTIETMLQVTELFQKAKIIQSYFHFFLNQLITKAGNLHSYITLASSLLILKQSPGCKKKYVSIHTSAIQANLAYYSFLVTGLLVLGCFTKALYLAFKIRTLLPL